MPVILSEQSSLIYSLCRPGFLAGLLGHDAVVAWKGKNVHVFGVQGTVRNCLEHRNKQCSDTR